MPDAPYLSVADVRAQVPDLADASAFPNDRITELVAEFESVAERYRGVAFTPRTATTTATPRSLAGPWRLGHIAVSSITTVTIDDVAVVGPTLGRIVPDRMGDILEPYSLWPAASATAVIAYVHGLAAVPPAVKRACRLYVRREALAEANPNTGNDYMRTNPDNGAIERDSTADFARRRPTGWLDVDRLLNQVEDRRPQGLI